MFKIPDFSLPCLCKQAGLDLVSAWKDLDPRTFVSGTLRETFAILTFCMTVRCAAHYARASTAQTHLLYMYMQPWLFFIPLLFFFALISVSIVHLRFLSPGRGRAKVVECCQAAWIPSDCVHGRSSSRSWPPIVTLVQNCSTAAIRSVEAKLRSSPAVHTSVLSVEELSNMDIF